MTKTLPVLSFGKTRPGDADAAPPGHPDARVRVPPAAGTGRAPSAPTSGWMRVFKDVFPIQDVTGTTPSSS